MPGSVPGTFHNTTTGETFALPSSFGAFHGFGPVTREEFDGLTARVDTFSDRFAASRPEAAAALVKTMESMNGTG